MAWENNHKVNKKDNPEWHEPVISIGTAAEKAGLSVSALRKYEREGLLLLYRTESGRRLLSQADIKRISVIQHLINRLGLNIEGIRRLLAILPCWKLKPCATEDRDRCPAYLDSVTRITARVLRETFLISSAVSLVTLFPAAIIRGRERRTEHQIHEKEFMRDGK